ncbi:MAG: hypothetical protein ACLUOS_06800 [Odoribacter splanchnicus]
MAEGTYTLFHDNQPYKRFVLATDLRTEVTQTTSEGWMVLCPTTVGHDWT